MCANQVLYWKTPSNMVIMTMLNLAWKHRLDCVLHHVLCSTEEDTVKEETETEWDWAESKLIFQFNLYKGV